MEQSEANPEFEALLLYLKQNQGYDLTGYKRSTLTRRFQHRMSSLNIEGYQSYLAYLQTHTEEHLSLLDDVFINVTSFFRDRAAWDYLAAEILPKIVANKLPDEQIRIWSAGCAAGQEIYSVLILLAEKFGLDFCRKRVQCYATDADEAALKQARQANYSELQMTGIPADLLEKYFVKSETGYSIHPLLRQSIIFGRHNLAKDAPISKIDLLLCRNVLIYFNAETQASILVRFHFSLKTTGFLFLGQAETLVNRRQIFAPINLKHRIYKKGLKLEIEDQLSIHSKSHRKPSLQPFTVQSHFWRTAFETNPVAQCAIDLEGCLVSANEQATLLFGLTLNDWNHPFHQLEPGKLLDSEALISKLNHCHQPQILKHIEWNTSNQTRYFDIAIAPVFSFRQKMIGLLLTFVDQ
ncbi:MAG: hypothetical protein KME18_03965 [Phormidium tanganyikae FI6-MK23]|jgi:two-component system CheB/CheR fusion protein|nr:hypothetical protein [Phormidium tanganyikae FI6-MK23]